MTVCYSINKCAYIMSNGCECTYKLDDNDKVYYVFYEPLAEVYAQQYEEDKQIRAFLDSYKEIREQTRRIKDICNIK